MVRTRFHRWTIITRVLHSQTPEQSAPCVAPLTFSPRYAGHHNFPLGPYIPQWPGSRIHATFYKKINFLLYSCIFLIYIYIYIYWFPPNVKNEPNLKNEKKCNNNFSWNTSRFSSNKLPPLLWNEFWCLIFSYDERGEIIVLVDDIFLKTLHSLNRITKNWKFHQYTI